MTNTTDQAKVYQLCVELEETKKRKKQVVSAFNDEIKRLQSEIKDVLNPQEVVDIHSDKLTV